MKKIKYEDVEEDAGVCAGGEKSPFIGGTRGKPLQGDSMSRRSQCHAGAGPMDTRGRMLQAWGTGAVPI